MAKRRRNSNSNTTTTTSASPKKVPSTKKTKTEAISPVRRSPRGGKNKKEDSVIETETGTVVDSLHLPSNDVHVHVLQLIAEKIGPNPGLLKLAAANESCKNVVGRQLASFRTGTTVDVEDYNKTQATLAPIWYNREEKKHANLFHISVREMINLLTNFAEGFPTSQNVLKNLSPSSLGWFYQSLESELARCPPLLQKKIVQLIKKKFNGTVEFTYHSSILRPSRFVRLFKHRLETITKLDLGDMKALRAVGLRHELFPKLTNLKELIWHTAEMWFTEALPYPHKLESLCLTLQINGINDGTMLALMNCQGLKKLHTGIHRPPMNRLVWTVVLKSYQAFWNQRKYRPEDLLQDKGMDPVKLKEGMDKDFTYRAFPKLEQLSFWDAPEYLFVTMAKENIIFKELQFGLLTQDLQAVCSLDSIMQALFKYQQPENILPIYVDHLKLYTHSMPVVQLDYYLPNLMDSLGKCLPSLQTLDLFVHTLIGGASMPSSWILEKTRPKRPKPKFDSLIKFNFHIDSYCLLDNLDTYLPQCIQSISLSFVQPRETRKKFLASLLKFIEYLGDINRFPDLDELHIQVWGISCFESIANAIVDHLPSLEKLSLITVPVNKIPSTVMELIGHVVEKCIHLREFGLSSDMVKMLSDEADTKEHLNNVLFNLGERCGINKECALSIRRLPELTGWNNYIVKPIHPDEDEMEPEEGDEEDETSDDRTDDDEEVSDEDMNSFIARESEAEEDLESDDELDAAEKALEKEGRRIDKRWERRRARMISESSNQSEDDDNVIVFRKRRGDEEEESGDDVEEKEEAERNPFIDDEAEEASEESEEDETEPEGEDIDQSDDEELFEAQVQLINARPRRHSPPKRKGRIIIESDSD